MSDLTSEKLDKILTHIRELEHSIGALTVELKSTNARILSTNTLLDRLAKGQTNTLPAPLQEQPKQP